jgi:hypothetical protein
MKKPAAKSKTKAAKPAKPLKKAGNAPKGGK